MRRLIWIFTGRSCPNVRLLTLWFIKCWHYDIIMPNKDGTHFCTVTKANPGFIWFVLICGQTCLRVTTAKHFRRCLRRAMITEHSLPMIPRGRANKSWQTLHVPQTEEKQDSHLHISQRGDHNAGQNQSHATIRHQTGQNPQRAATRPHNLLNLFKRSFVCASIVLYAAVILSLLFPHISFFLCRKEGCVSLLLHWLVVLMSCAH